MGAAPNTDSGLLLVAAPNGFAVVDPTPKPESVFCADPKLNVGAAEDWLKPNEGWVLGGPKDGYWGAVLFSAGALNENVDAVLFPVVLLPKENMLVFGGEAPKAGAGACVSVDELPKVNGLASAVFVDVLAPNAGDEDPKLKPFGCFGDSVLQKEETLIFCLIKIHTH